MTPATFNAIATWLSQHVEYEIYISCDRIGADSFRIELLRRHGALNYRASHRLIFVEMQINKLDERDLIMPLLEQLKNRIEHEIEKAAIKTGKWNDGE